MSEKKFKKRILLIPAILCLGIACIVLLNNMKLENSRKTVVGFISTGNENEDGWGKNHFDGIKLASKKLNVELIVKDNVAENSGRCYEAVKELLEAGANLIILNSYSYAEESKDLIKKNPKVIFYVNYASEEILSYGNVSTYFVRMYQARYLSGIVAGMQTKTNSVGYVAAMENTEVLRGINAFALGVKSVNPDAKVYVTWTGSWDDEKLERKAVNRLAAKTDIDIVTYHQNQPYVAESAKNLKIKSIGYHAVLPSSEYALTSVICKWDGVYEAMLKRFMQGKALNSSYYWVGIEEGIVGLSQFNTDVTAETWKTVENARQRMLSGWNIFSDEIYDNKGNLQCKEGEALVDDVLLEKIDWMVSNVQVLEDK